MTQKAFRVNDAEIREIPDGVEIKHEGRTFIGRIPLTDFAGELDVAYMARQFLPWRPEYAEDVLRGLEKQERLAKMMPACRSADKWRQYLPDQDPLAGYDPKDVSTLVRIHYSFRQMVKASYRVVDRTLVRRD
jgi:hypothetical protein